MEPVEVAGSTVELATLHNADEVRAQGRADRRHGGAAQGRRRHPRDRRAGGGAARRHRARVRHADALPRVRHRAAPAEGGRRRHPLPQRPLVPRPAAGAAVPRRPAAARSTSRCSATRRRSRCSRPGSCTTRAMCSRSTADDAARRPRSSRTKDGGAVAPTGAKLLANLETAQGRGRCGGCWSRCRSGTSARPPRRRWRASSARIDAIAAASRGGAGRGRRASGRRSPTAIIDWFAVDWHRGDRREVASRRRAAWPRSATSRRRRPWRG